MLDINHLLPVFLHQVSVWCSQSCPWTIRPHFPVLWLLGHCFLHLIKAVSTEQMSLSCHAAARSVRAAVPVPAGGVQLCPYVPVPAGGVHPCPSPCRSCPSLSLKEMSTPVPTCTSPGPSTPAGLPGSCPEHPPAPLAPAQLPLHPTASGNGNRQCQAGKGKTMMDWEGKGNDGLGREGQ